MRRSGTSGPAAAFSESFAPVAMITLDLPPSVDEARARLLLAIALFQEEEVSVGQAAEIAGLSYRDFLDALRERGIPAYIYTEEMWEQDLATLRKMDARGEPS